MQLHPPRTLFFASQIVLLGVLIALFPDRFLALHVHWITPADLDMGYVLLAAAVLFSFQILGKLQAPTPSPLALLLFVPLSAAFFLAHVLDIKALFFVALMGSLFALTALSLGWRHLWALLLPLGILNMAMPYWYLAIKPLQAMTVKAANTAVDWASLTVLVEGNYITVPTGVVHIAGGCSGLKYFLTALSISLIASAWNNETLKVALRNLGIVAAVAILANWIRVIILVFTAYNEGIDHPWMADHDALGWWVFGIMMLPWFYFTQRRPALAPASDDASTEQTERVNHADAAAPRTPIVAAIVAASSYLVIAIALVSAPQLLLLQSKHQDIPEVSIAPSAIDQYVITYNTAKDGWHPSFDSPDSTQHQRILLDGKEVDIWQLRYAHAGESEMAKTTNRMFGEHWLQVQDSAWQGDGLKLRIAVGSYRGKRRTVYYWYQHGNHMQNSIMASKMARLKALGSSEHYADVIAVAVPCTTRCGRDPDSVDGLPALIKTLSAAPSTD